ncbi:MAG: hypothetical protein PHP29_01420 [Tissierellia bacterium]|nr:hypothetical protein [Tissierellia bacterium]
MTTTLNGSFVGIYCHVTLFTEAIDLGYCTNEDLPHNYFVRHDGYYWEE